MAFSRHSRGLLKKNTQISRKVAMFRHILLSALMVSPAAAESFKPLFDGSSLDGWEGDPQIWRVENGAIAAQIKQGDTLKNNNFLYHKEQFGDFILELDFQISGDPSANSGIQFRSRKQPDGHAAGYQADIDQGKTWLGSIYDEHGRKLIAERGVRTAIAPDGRTWHEPFVDPADYPSLLRPAGQWNQYRIEAKGPSIEIRVNGVRVSALDDHEAGKSARKGLIAFQLHSGRGPARIAFRNIRISDMGESPESLPGAWPPRAAAPKQENPSNEEPPLTRDKDADYSARWHDSPVLWQLQPNKAPASKVGNPAAQKLVADLKLPTGFHAELIAAEPDVHQPIAMAFDDKGRLWIAEAFNYPVRAPEGKGRDRIIILADEDADGHFETRKIFMEGLNLVSGFELGFGGVWVGAAPHFMFIPDRNQDDKPDGPPEVLLDGWGYQDTHETLNSFTWGPDGWLYGCQGVFVQSKIGKPGTPGKQRIPLTAGVWRYHPLRHEFEVFARGGSNQWGLDFNEEGDLFMTHCRSFYGGGGTTHVIRNAIYWNQSNRNYGPLISSTAPPFAPGLKNFMLASARYDSGEGGAGLPGTTAVYGGHSHVGTMIYLGDNWPAIYHNHLFTHNLHGHQINHQRNVRSGSGYETFHAGSDVLFSPDPSYLPVDLQTGPDGAVYSIDWSDTQHCHNPSTEVWDRSNGRIYRMHWAATYKPRSVNLRALDDRALADLHTHANEWFVRTARRLLQERAALKSLDPAALAGLSPMLSDTKNSVVPRLRALWTLHVTGSLTGEMLAALLADPNETIRSWAVRLATDDRAGLRVKPAELASLAANDPSAAVRLSVASALPLLPAGDRWNVAEALAARTEDAHDRNLPKMTWLGIGDIVNNDPERALKIASTTHQQGLADSIMWYIAKTPEGRNPLAARIANGPQALATRARDLLAFALENETNIKPPNAWEKAKARFPDAESTSYLDAIFGNKQARSNLVKQVENPSLNQAERTRSLGLLRRLGTKVPSSLISKLLDNPDFRQSAVAMLRQAENPVVAAEMMLEHFDKLDGNSGAALLETLCSRADLALPLLKAAAEKRFDSKNLTSLHARQLATLKHPEVNKFIESFWGRSGASSPDLKQKIISYRKAFRKAPAWSYNREAGKTHYQRLCMSCHIMNGEGGRLGPDLSGTWRNGLDYFLENTIDPNAVVGKDYQLNLITQKDGTVTAGMIEKESDTSIVVRTMTDTVTIPKTEVAGRQVTPNSLMPAGLLDSLSEDEANELLRFLTDDG
jgi:putative membrane-bound dehydrogenase-like protein